MIRLADEATCAARQAQDVARGPLRPFVRVPQVLVSLTETGEFIKGHRQWEALCFAHGCLAVYKNADRRRVEDFVTEHVLIHRSREGGVQGEFSLGFMDRMYRRVLLYDLVLDNGRTVCA